MNAAKAQTVASEIIAAGYSAEAFKLNPGQWAVRMRSKSGYSIPIETITDIVTVLGVLGKVAEAEFI